MGLEILAEADTPTLILNTFFQRGTLFSNIKLNEVIRALIKSFSISLLQLIGKHMVTYVAASTVSQSSPGSEECSGYREHDIGIIYLVGK
jgi:hypothetical protein